MTIVVSNDASCRGMEYIQAAAWSITRPRHRVSPVRGIEYTQAARLFRTAGTQTGHILHAAFLLLQPGIQSWSRKPAFLQQFRLCSTGWVFFSNLVIMGRGAFILPFLLGEAFVPPTGCLSS